MFYVENNSLQVFYITDFSDPLFCSSYLLVVNVTKPIDLLIDSRIMSGIMVFNATINNISATSWLSGLVEEIQSTWRKPPTCRKSDKLYHKVLY
jgi:hypothetical protein